MFAQHYSLVVFYPIQLWFTYAWFIQTNTVQVGPRPPKSAQVLPGPPRKSPTVSTPGSPRKSRKPVQNRRKYLVLPGKPGNPTKSQKITPNFSQEISEPPHNRRNHYFPGRTWENLGEPGRTWGNLGEPGGTWGTWENLGEPGGTWVETSWEWGFLRRAWESCKS